MLTSTHTLDSPTPATLEGYLLEGESSMIVSFVSEYSHRDLISIEKGGKTVVFSSIKIIHVNH